MEEQVFSDYQKYQTMMRKIEKHNSIRLKITAGMLFADVPLALIPLAGQYGLIFVIIALLYLAGIMISFVFSVPETPKICGISAILTLIGICSGVVCFPVGLILFALLAWVIPDYKKLKFLKQQKGYPQFSERFDEQSEHFGKDYQPEHLLDNVHHAEMKDAFEETPEEIFTSTAQAVEMPAAPELTERSDFYAE